MKYLFVLLITLYTSSSLYCNTANVQDSTQCLKLSMKQYTAGNYETAYKNFSSCLKDIPDTASEEYHACILYMGICALENAEYKKAASLLHNAESNFNQSSDNYFICKQYLAALAKRLGNYSEAETILVDLLRIQEDSLYPNCGSHAITLNDLGVIYKRLGQYERSIYYFKKSLELKSRCLDAEDPSITISLNNLAGVYMKQKDFEHADSLYSESIKIKTKRYGPNHPSVLIARNNLAELYRQQGKYNASLAILQDIKNRRATTIGKKTLPYATTLHTIANVYYSSGDYKHALHYCEKSIVIKEHNAGKAAGTTMHDYVLQARSLHSLNRNKKAQAVYDFILKTKKEEIDTYFQYLGEEDKIQYVKANTTYWKDFTAFVFDVEADSNTNISNKKILFNQWIEYRWYVSEIILKETQRQHRLWENITDSTQIELIEELKEIKDDIARIYLFKSKDDSKSTTELNSLTDRASQIEKELTNTFCISKQEQHTVIEISSALDSTECIVEIIKPLQASGKYLALIYFKNIDSPYKIWLSKASVLEGKGYSFYKNSIKFKHDDTTSLDLFWKPITDLINSFTGITKIYLVRDGIYEYINIHTLLPNTNTHTIVYLNETESILSYKQRTAFITLDQSLFIYHPIYASTTSDCPYVDLPGTKNEVDTIQLLFDKNSLHTTRYGEKMASETQIKNDTCAYSLIHVATHGYLDINPEGNYIESMIHSGLLLSGVCDTPTLETDVSFDDGILTSYEIAQLNLNATDLVVLSACQSGLGIIDNQEGILGLQRGLFVAGAKKILVSLWKIDDAITSEWMYYFYSNLTETQSCFDAYIVAQQKIKELHPSPYYWGAFVLLEQ